MIDADRTLRALARDLYPDVTNVVFGFGPMDDLTIAWQPVDAPGRAGRDGHGPRRRHTVPVTPNSLLLHKPCPQSQYSPLADAYPSRSLSTIIKAHRTAARIADAQE